MFLKLYGSENVEPVYVDPESIEQIDLMPADKPDPEADVWFVVLHLRSRKQLTIECHGADVAEMTANRIIAATGRRVEPVTLYKNGKVAIGLVDYGTA